MCCGLSFGRLHGIRTRVDPNSDPSSYALLAFVRQIPWYQDPSGSKWIQADPSESKLVCFAGCHSANSMVSGSKWIQMDPSTDPSSYVLLAITRQTPWYQGPSGSKWIQARIQAHMLCWLSLGRLHGIGIQVDPSGSKHGSKLICFAGYHSADSIVSGSKWIQARIQAL